MAPTFGPGAAAFLAEPLGEKLHAVEASVASHGEGGVVRVSFLWDLKVILGSLKDDFWGI